jgi:DNA-directed RNA polymerase II subunit RPB2
MYCREGLGLGLVLCLMTFFFLVNESKKKNEKKILRKIEDKMWEETILNSLLKSFFEEYKQSYVQIENFNHAINYRIKKIIEEELVNIKINDTTYFRIFFNNVTIEKPCIVENRKLRKIYPMEAKIRDITYTGSILADINTCYVHQNESGGGHTITEYKCYRKKTLARLPIMIGSTKCNLYDLSEEERIEQGECKYDYGGYFIIRGKERVLVSQERMNYNETYCFESKSGNRMDSVCEIRSISSETRHSVYLQLKFINHKTMITIPYISNDIPLGYVFTAYGYTTEEIKKILDLFFDKDQEKYYKYIILDMIRIRSQENAINYIAENAASIVMKENRTKFVSQVLSNEIFPHLGISSTDHIKILFLCKMYRKLIMTVFENKAYDSRDHINNKRLEMSGTLVSDLFRTLFKRYIKTISLNLDKRQDIVAIMNKISIISLGIMHCFSTGNWGVPKSSFIRLGVSQILSRLTNPSYMSHLLRVLIPIGKEAKNVKVRQVHCSSIGYYCPMETPEGQQAGIVKNLTPFVRLSVEYNSTLIKEIIESLSSINVNFRDCCVRQNQNKLPFFVFLNGSIVGFTYDENKLLCELKLQKKNNVLSDDISISIRKTDYEVHIFSDEGRLRRPLFLKENLPSLEDLSSKSFSQLMKEKKIVFLDSYEVDNRTIAMTKEELDDQHFYNALEIHPSFMTGFSVNLIPYPNNTQSPRVTYHCAMGKQAIGLPFTNIHNRVDTVNYMLSYPERPIIQSHYSEYNNLNNLGFGVNLCVAIMSYTGYNQEDSIILSQSAIDRGLLQCFSYRTIIVEEKKKSTLSTEKIENHDYKNNSFNYNKLNENGIVKIGVYVGCGDVLVSKLQKINNKDNFVWRDASVIVKSGEEGIVDKVYMSTTTDGYRVIKIKIRLEKKVEIGDKLASRCAQKGTVSLVLRQEDMPFSEETGMVPDLILNPLCIPSRMTICQLIEMYLSDKSLLYFKKYYSTIFFQKNNEILMEELKKDSSNFSNHNMINGMTGERIQAKIFLGPCHYHRLKHLVSNKIHSRNNGNMQLMTRQPLEGRSRDGGLRFGEMERDCVIAHGSSRFLRERLFEVSDYFEIFLCSHCGNIPHQTNTCNFCKKKNIVKIAIPYACKLLFQQLMALGLKINIFPEKKKSS